MNKTLRPYQAELISRIRKQFRQGVKSVLMTAPTGSGKTIMFCYIAESAVRLGNRVIILVHRKELIRQCSIALNEMDVPHGIIAPGHTPTFDMVQIASVQTLVRRLEHIQEPRLLVIDEGHHIAAGSWDAIFRHYSNAHVLGVTATPVRLDGKGLKNYYQSLVEYIGVKDLIRLGYLTQPVVYGPPMNLDLSNLRTKFGDFDKNGLNEAMDKPTITGDCVKHYANICNGLPAIVFTVSMRHAQHVAEEFNRHGIPAAPIDWTLPDIERKKRIDDLGNGTIKVLVSCELVSEGIDIPIVSAAILLRPTKSLALYLQQVGRVLRPYPEKKCSYILDHVGNMYRHGFPDDDREWTLETGYARQKKEKESVYFRYIQCEKCYAILPAEAVVCSQCGAPIVKRSREVEQVDGSLKLFTAEEREKLRLEYIKHCEYMYKRREEGMAKTLAELQEIAKKRGYNPKWAFIRWNMRNRKKVFKKGA